MSLGCLFGAVTRSVATHHLRPGVSEEVLDVNLTGILLDRPGGECVAEPVRVDSGDSRAITKPTQEMP